MTIWGIQILDACNGIYNELLSFRKQLKNWLWKECMQHKFSNHYVIKRKYASFWNLHWRTPWAQVDVIIDALNSMSILIICVSCSWRMYFKLTIPLVDRKLSEYFLSTLHRSNSIILTLVAHRIRAMFMIIRKKQQCWFGLRKMKIKLNVRQICFVIYQDNECTPSDCF